MILKKRATASDGVIVGGGLTPRPRLRGQARAYANAKAIAIAIARNSFRHLG